MQLDRGQFMIEEPAAAFEELTRASAGGKADYGGVSYARINAENGVFWPCKSATDPGSPRLFADRFPTPDGKDSLLRGGIPPAPRKNPTKLTHST